MRKYHVFDVLVSLFVIISLTTETQAEKKSACSTGTLSTVTKEPLIANITQDLDTLFLWDFEDGDGGFVAKNMGDVGTKWHATDEHWTLDGSKAWWCGEYRERAGEFENVWGYNDLWSQTLDIPHPIYLPGTSNPVLSFDARWHCEGSDLSDPTECNDDSPDWDGLAVLISTDGGATFPGESFLLPIDMTHTAKCGSLWSFQVAAGYFPEGGINGLNGDSEGWVHMEYPLDNYKMDEVVIRFHFCSDQCLSSIADNSCNTPSQDTSFHGFFLDNISVQDGATTFFFDNADDEAYMVPGYTFRSNVWQYVDAQGHSPTHSWVGDGDDEWDLRSVWLETPWLEFPAGCYPELRYWFKCDMPDFDGDHDTELDDWYHVDITEDGVSWTKLFDHWAREPEGFSDTTGYIQNCHFETWWGHLYNETIYNGHMTLFDYPGKTVKLRWMTYSDANDDCGNGTGLSLDDIEIVAREMAPFDIGIERIDYSTPNTVGSPVTVTLTIRNYGLNTGYWYFFYEIWDDQDNKVLPATPGVADYFDVGEIRKISFDWSPSDPGIYRVLGFRFEGEDDYGPNDSLYSAWINVFPANEGAMFDHHFLIDAGQRFGEGSGVAIHLFPPDWMETFKITEGAIQYMSGEGPYTVHTFTTTVSDTEDVIDVADIDILTSVNTHTSQSKLPDWPIPDIPPGFDQWGQNWYGVDLSGDENVKCVEGDFFLFIQHGPNHSGYIPYCADPDPPSECFIYDPESLRFVRSNYDFVLRTGITWPGESLSQFIPENIGLNWDLLFGSPVDLTETGEPPAPVLQSYARAWESDDQLIWVAVYQFAHTIYATTAYDTVKNDLRNTILSETIGDEGVSSSCTLGLKVYVFRRGQYLVTAGSAIMNDINTTPPDPLVVQQLALEIDQRIATFTQSGLNPEPAATLQFMQLSQTPLSVQREISPSISTQRLDSDLQEQILASEETDVEIPLLLRGNNNGSITIRIKIILLNVRTRNEQLECLYKSEVYIKKIKVGNDDGDDWSKGEGDIFAAGEVSTPCTHIRFLTKELGDMDPNTEKDFTGGGKTDGRFVGSKDCWLSCGETSTFKFDFSAIAIVRDNDNSDALDKAAALVGAIPIEGAEEAAEGIRDAKKETPEEKTDPPNPITEARNVYGDDIGEGNRCVEGDLPRPPACDSEKGDTNGDFETNILDVLRLVNWILGLIGFNECEEWRSDCNCDEEINVVDALGIVNVILGIGECCPGACKAELTLEVMEYFKSLEPYFSPEDFARLMALVKGEIQVPTEFSLAQNYPNPCNPKTDIRYQIPDSRSPVHTSLKIYNILGQEVRTLVDEVKEAGYYTVTWDGKDHFGNDVASGIYFYRLIAGNYTDTKRMVLLK